MAKNHPAVVPVEKVGDQRVRLVRSIRGQGVTGGWQHVQFGTRLPSPQSAHRPPHRSEWTSATEKHQQRQADAHELGIGDPLWCDCASLHVIPLCGEEK